MNIVKHLIDQFTPEHYELSLELNRENRTFVGTVAISGVSSDNSDHIAVHAKDLFIETALIDGHEAEFETGENDEIAFKIEGLQPGKHVLTIGFNGKITDVMHGLYPCYFEHNDVKKELLATQFESHHAREVFPCIDEPEAKSTFDVSLLTERGVNVLGNMPVKTQREEKGRLLTVFEKSPRMSTYLLAFVVGEMQHKTAKTKSGVEVNVWATHAQPAESLDFALETSVSIIEFYNDYFGAEYPLPKCDHVALPDFSSGAMENWGLITYREVALLADPKIVSISSRQYIALVIAHELAHQWFGNLVTMKWWNNLWLNESFASLMEYIAIDAIHPDWNAWLDFSTDNPIPALRRDAIDGVQSVQTDVSHPDEITTLFDGAIVYAKGARLLRMVQKYVGDEAFQAGLKQYFQDFAYQNTEADDLWRAIAKSSGKNIVEMMNTWISQPGYPVVHVKSGVEYSLTQEQFFIGQHEASEQLWPIPLAASDDGAPELMSEKTISFKPSDKNAVRFNVGDSAHFITHYDEVTLGEHIKNLDKYQPLDRMQLLHEATLLARAGIMPTAQLIPLIQAYENEESEQVWTIIAMALVELRKFVENNPDAETKLRQLSGKIAAKQYKRLGWEAKSNESEYDTKLRSTIIGLTLFSEDEDALATARKYYETTKLEDLSAELRPLILSSVVRYGDSQIVEDLLKAHQETSSSELQNDIAVGMTATRIPESMDVLLEALQDSKIVRPQDAFRWFAYLIRSKDSRVKTWQWLRDNWDWVDKMFSGDKSYDIYPRISAQSLVTRKQLAEYREFFEPKQNIIALNRVITMGILEIESRVELIERDQDAVQKALLDL